jgi:putative ABC transport system ATP-binding protein
VWHDHENSSVGRKSLKDPVLQVSQLSKSYMSGDRSLLVLDEVSFEISRGGTCAIVGPSGSGKTTLLGLCAGLDRPSSGGVCLIGRHLSEMSEEELAKLRNQSVGFVFQTFQLIPTLTALENVMVPLELRGESGVRKRAVELLSKVGLIDRVNHYPTQLSGGEQQRVSLARAFINRPQLLFADEPTGNLDSENAELVENLLFEMNRENGTTLVLVTHNLELAGKTERIISLKAGSVVSDRPALVREGVRP